MTDMLRELAEVVASIKGEKRCSDIGAAIFIRAHHTTISQNAESAYQLGQLLAVIHADGGHYLAEHGMRKSVDDAIAIYSSVLVELDAKSDEAKRLKALEQAIDEVDVGKWVRKADIRKRADEIMTSEPLHQ